MKLKLILGLALVLSGVFTGESSNAQDADVPPATNVISRFLDSRLAVLSLTRSPSVSRQFEFDVLAAYPAIPDLPWTVMRVVANQDQAAVLIQNTNGLPYGLMENGLVVVCDPKRAGGLAYYEGDMVHWNFSKKNKVGNIDYSWGVDATNVPTVVLSEVDLDLRSILQDIPLDRVKVTFDQQDRRLQIVSSKVFLSVTISQKGDSKSFGADRIAFSGGGVSLAISDIHVGAPLALQPLFGLSKADIEKIGLPLRQLHGNEFTNILTVPPNFPASDKEAVTAKRLQWFLIARCAQQATNVPAQFSAPDTTHKK